VLLCFKLHSP